MNLRTYHDPLHLAITLVRDNPVEEMVLNLIDSQPFQRLRRIRQLGPAFLTFHGAESSRFTHSLGVFYLARKALKSLRKIDPDLIKYQGILYGASLLHDIGHGPLSHTSEGMFNLSHEKWSAKLIRELPEIRDILEGYSKGTADQIAELIENNKCKSSIIKSLISSQLDCDRLDYLMRDSYSTGTNYGKLDLERILSALNIAPDGTLAIHPKGLLAVEHYLVVRNLMYRSVYNHRLNEVNSWLLEKIIQTAIELGPQKIWADKYMTRFLWDKDNINIETFLKNDDIRLGYHIHSWDESSPKPLSELCKRFLHRDLLKAINVESLNSESQLKALAISRKLAEKEGKDSNYCCGLRRQKHQSYHPYKSGLRLWDGVELKSIESSSALIRGLIAPAQASWLIYPREINNDLKKSIKDLINYQDIQ